LEGVIRYTGYFPQAALSSAGAHLTGDHYDGYHRDDIMGIVRQTYRKLDGELLPYISASSRLEQTFVWRNPWK
jgi:hypothetical protein